MAPRLLRSSEVNPSGGNPRVAQDGSDQPRLRVPRPLGRAGAAAMLLVGWALSGWMFVVGHRQQARDDEAGFSRLVAEAQQAIEQRMTTYVDALRSGASLIYALRRVERAEWMTFAKTLDVPGRYPGINGIGVIFPVPPEETDAFLRRVRADWAPEFLIHPVPGGAVPADSGQYVITYIAPMAGNEAAVGLDVATEPVRRQAADAARDLGEPRITGRITLVQDESRGPGFLLYVPVYRNGAPLATVAERRAALDAWVYAPFVTERFLASVVGTRVETFRLHVFERDQRDTAHLLYTSDPRGAGLPEFEQVTSIDLAGQPLTLGWTRGAHFTPASRSPLTWLAAMTAVAVPLLVGWTRSLQTFGERAEALVAERTAALRDSEYRWKFAIEGSGDGLWDWDVQTGAVYFSARWKEMFGFAEDEIGDGVDEWRNRVHPGDKALALIALQAHLDGTTPLYACEHRVQCKDGSWKWTLGRGVVVARDAGGRPLRVIGTQSDITERKGVEATLRESEQQLVLAQQIGHSGSWMYNLETGRIWASAEGLRMFGFPPEAGEYPIEDLEACIPERERVNQALVALISEGREYKLEYVVHPADGSAPKLVSSLAIVDRDPQGKALKVVGFVQDITERKRAEEALRVSESRFRAMFVDAPLGVALVDSLTGHLDEVNSRFAEIVGRTTAEMVGIDWMSITHPDDLQEDLDNMALLNAGKIPGFNMAKRYRRPDGSWVWISMTIAQVTVSDPARPKHLCMIEDISARRQAEAALVASEMSYRRLFETAQTGILILDADTGAVTDVNPFLVELLGYTREVFLGRKVWELGFFRNVVANHAKFEELQRKAYVRYEDMPLEARDGRTIDVEFISNLYLVDRRKVIQCNIRDITERRLMETALRESLREKGALLKEVHHRVKNNLQVVVSLLRLEAGRSEHAVTRSVLGDMQGRIRSMALLHEALYRSGTFASVDLGAYLGELVTQAFRAGMPSSGAVRLHLELASLRVEMDQALPCGLLVNELVSNCLKHGFPDGRTGEVRVELRRVEGGPLVRLRVSDTGIGLPADFAAKRAGALGLELVSDLAHQLRGTLENEPGPAAIFTVTFPAHEPKADVSPAAAP